VQTVGVFVTEDPRRIQDIVDFCSLDMVQLHGDEPPALCGKCMPKTIKAFHLNDEISLQSLEPYCEKVRAFLFDTHSKENRGGTGKTFDWDLAIKSKRLGVPVILAGGLNPSNIRDAILSVKPYAVDVNSGIEESPGKKSLLLMRQVMDEIRSIDSGKLPGD
jgi:phosphoribosylanthranilate isomerase